ncbi:hypothetical protein Scep_026549 [Stephania cephalantha]|uniref:Uncharacterized protein n=1 Tax=Stephania cephalantha TaxID=152367 RepID=A0AAP0EKC4_9MAGN
MKVSKVTVWSRKGKRAGKEKIGKGAVKNTGKESTALRDTSSEEEMEEEEGNKEDSPIGQGFMNTSDEEGCNLPDDSDEYTEEEHNSLIRELMKKIMMRLSMKL